ncbi:MAG: hypothetical protein LBC06_01505 [Rickettsiales bacterium]|jgi:hypothetical protein|nr:hypothetical protein [Rickettsiales bacterium]
MHSNKGDRKKSDRVVRGGGVVDMSKLDPSKIDDFRERIRREEEERKRNQSSGKVVAEATATVN